MNMSGVRNACLLAVGLIGAVGAANCPATAAEPAQKFLQGLRERGYYDTAVEYLERMKTSPLAPIELKEVLLYEMGTTLIEASRLQRDVALREKQLDEARNALQRFVGQHPDHALVASANSQLGNLMVERARIKVEQANRPRADKAALMGEAKQVYDEAYKVFAKSQNDLKEKLAQMQASISPNDNAAIELRDQLRADYLQAQLLAAAIREEAADTVAKGSAEHTATLTDAAGLYGEIYEKYRQRLAGLYARMYQGRCHSKMGKWKDALSFYEELLEQPDEPDAFRELKTKTLLLAVECWLALDPPLYAEAVKRLDPWLKNVRPNEAKTPEWLELRLALARSQWAVSQAALEKKANDPEAKRLEREARSNAQFVTRVTGDWQQEARELLAAWGGPAIDDSDRPEPKTFDEAKQAGRDALQAAEIAKTILRDFPSRIQKEKDEAVRADLQQQLDEAQQSLESSQDDAIRYFRLALKLADDQTSLQDVNIVRYFLTFLHYSNADYYESALAGEFVARRYPDSSGARPCAKIAMASYLKLYTEEPSEDKQFETAHVIQIAQYITDTWPDQPEAVEALNTLIPFMIQAGQLDEAEKYLYDIPEDSPKRGAAEIKTGQAMWSAYLKGMNELRDQQAAAEQAGAPAGDVAAREQELQQLKDRAQKILEGGVGRMKASGKIDESTATAALSLSQIYVDTGQTDRAVTLLEDPQIGPLTLVRANHAATAREGYPAETYKTALRAYISSLSTATDSDAVIQKATDVMDAMKAAIAQDQLVAIYVSLARDLEEQMKLATPATRTALSKGFETFLTRLRSGATEFSVLNWVAETFSSLASGFDTGQQLTAEAKKYYDEAAATYQAILDKAQLDDPNLKTQVLLRMAATKRRLFKFTDARDIYVQVLKQSEAMLNVQVDAAKLYQEWAAFPGSESLYLKAMGGAEKDSSTGKNVVWGWGRLFQITARYPEYRDVFHEARYNLAVCRYEYGRSLKSPDEQTEQWDKAQSAILQTQKLYGSGPEWEKWRPEYDALLKKVQKALKVPAEGLPPDPLPGSPAAT
jgi:tetratricopeptide (TPR) repeat protein